MKALVCGGRNFRDKEKLFDRMDFVLSEYRITEIIHGAALGADSLADAWALTRGIPSKRFPADWVQHGKAAGPIRNAQMLAEKPDVVVAFPGEKGTADMVKKSRAAGIQVIEWL